MRFLSNNNIKLFLFGKSYSSLPPIKTIQNLFFSGLTHYKKHNGHIANLSHFENHIFALYYFNSALRLAREHQFLDLTKLLKKVIKYNNRLRDAANQELENTITTNFKTPVANEKALNAVLKLEDFFNPPQNNLMQKP